MRGHTRHGWFAVAVVGKSYHLLDFKRSPFAVWRFVAGSRMPRCRVDSVMAPHKDLIATFQEQLDRALDAGDTERAQALRQRLDELERGGVSYLRPQQPGAMGLGTSDEVPRRPAGWKPPKKPDPMTSGTSRRR